MTDSVGKVVERITYSSFGKILSMKDGSGSQLAFGCSNCAPLNQPYYFTGREYDDSTDLNYYRARYYDANTDLDRVKPTRSVTSVGSSIGTTNYSYDQNGFLITASGNVNETYAYDALGNRITDQNGNYIYDETGQKLNEDYNYTYHYDNNGNMVMKISKSSAEVVQYSYSSENQLLGVDYFPNATSAATKSVRYTYDAIGRRVEKRVTDYANIGDVSKTFTRRYMYDAEELLVEMDGSNQVLARFTHSSLRTDDVLSISVTSTGVSEKIANYSGSYMFLKDHLGSVREIADTNGNILQRYLYNSFGKIIEIRDGAGNNITNTLALGTAYAFTGREFDKETGLYYYRARYYDSNIGRFLQQDPEPGRVSKPITALNKYVYVGNNALNYIDPSGKDFWDVLIGIAVIVAAVYTGGAAGAFLGELAGGAVGGGIAGGIVGGVAGVISGALVGGVVGAGIGGLGYSLIGRNFEEGASKFGALGLVVGGIAGGIAGGFAGYSKNASAFGNYFSQQVKLAKDQPTRYFLDLGYNNDPFFGIPNTYLGGGFAGPSLGGTAVYGSIALFLGDPQRPESN